MSPLNNGWNFSATKYPIVASIETRPCVTSASRYRLISWTGRSSRKFRGSNSPTGASAPGSPAQNLFGSAVHPLTVGYASRDVELIFNDCGENAVTLLTKIGRTKANFMFTVYLLSACNGRGLRCYDVMEMGSDR